MGGDHVRMVPCGVGAHTRGAGAAGCFFKPPELKTPLRDYSLLPPSERFLTTLKDPTQLSGYRCYVSLRWAVNEYAVFPWMAGLVWGFEFTVSNVEDMLIFKCSLDLCG